MLINGDAIEALRKFGSNSVNSLITDPPAGINFMGKNWDDYGSLDNFQRSMQDIFKEVYRVLKPGAHGLVWSIPRTSHHTAMALEKSGFEVRDVITHLFGSGFPKSLNIEKALEKQNSDRAKEFAGLGTALKPAAEFWILVRKPLSEKTVAENVLKYGTGGLNIDGSRVEAGSDLKPIYSGAKGRKQEDYGLGSVYGNSEKYLSKVHTQGRFPANLVLDQEAAAALDEQSGQETSRFFYVAKVSTRERNEGLEDLEDKICGRNQANFDGGKILTGSGNERSNSAKNHHPTVKSIKLMSYLINLITPPNGTILDCFMGSGSTGCAAVQLGFDFIGIEKEKEYFEIAKKRIEHWSKNNGTKCNPTLV